MRYDLLETHDGELAAAEAFLTEAVAVALAAGTGWFTALARVGLADVRQARGDVSAATLLREVVARGAGSAAAGTGRVTFFRRLAGDPFALAEARLAAPTSGTSGG